MTNNMQMKEIRRTKTEYGGFLPIELNPGEEFFLKYEPNLCRFNSVKAALYFLINRIGLKKIYLPYYYCPSTTEAIRKIGLEVIFYHIDEELMPIEIPDKRDSIVLLVDYFGVCGERVKTIAKSFRQAEVILDRAHAFFEEPIISGRIHNVYSAKKFFGIPDGAYLISNMTVFNKETLINANNYADYLMVAYEEGTNAAYVQKKAVDKKIADNYNCMSKLSIGLLRNVDYDRVRQSRENNYKLLYEAFKDVNELNLPLTCAAYQFPLLIKRKGREIKKKLIDERIFVSTLWSGKDLVENGNEFEHSMMNDAIFLPMDQRYGEEDMKYIECRVRANL